MPPKGSPEGKIEGKILTFIEMCQKSLNSTKKLNLKIGFRDP